MHGGKLRSTAGNGEVLIISIGIVGSINCDSVGIVDQAFFA
jgi:hypothetical protein